ncbi:nuclear transport factor 2 family protein [Streptomyces griseoaurantiacus]|uniref:SnoaL-like domain-containing protein n=2 Tax=Streptomyces griseoaurantiacus TaxID=68213 RepID=F3NEC4_9ACTN|nr:MULTISPECIES: nuclear transport factor 2 family protein [Streptomyces]EGG48193.1 hypothetical protein SGM_1488 [Streptomyces griseoaurantiacus M045]WTI27556.1 nuclear transport factor 2 family protein [Streptomyces jietaisiensis]
MNEKTTTPDILRRMENAMNAHDLDAFADCFAGNLRSRRPLHPQSGITDHAKMRENWAGLFAHVPDLVAAVQRSAEDGDQVWAEWEIGGTTVESARYLSRGVTILTLENDRIASVRFYLDNVDPEVQGADV